MRRRYVLRFTPSSDAACGRSGDPATPGGPGPALVDLIRGRPLCHPCMPRHLRSRVWAAQDAYDRDVWDDMAGRRGPQ
jgi:hypothetical protein